MRRWCLDRCGEDLSLVDVVGWRCCRSLVGWILFLEAWRCVACRHFLVFVHPAIDMGAVSRSRDARDADNEAGISFSVSVRSVNAGG